MPCTSRVIGQPPPPKTKTVTRIHFRRTCPATNSCSTPPVDSRPKQQLQKKTELHKTKPTVRYYYLIFQVHTRVASTKAHLKHSARSCTGPARTDVVVLERHARVTPRVRQLFRLAHRSYAKRVKKVASENVRAVGSAPRQDCPCTTQHYRFFFFFSNWHTRKSQSSFFEMASTSSTPRKQPCTVRYIPCSRSMHSFWLPGIRNNNK